MLAPNKSLAAQLAAEFREMFPKNRVEYFVSYYDYYQPEAYLPTTDTYIEKDSSINDEIDRLRHSATSALLTRRDVIIVASVSAIYGLGSPEMYGKQLLMLSPGDERDQREILRRLVELQYERNDFGFTRNKFRVRGDTIEVFPAYEEHAIRISALRRRGGAHRQRRPAHRRGRRRSSTALALFPASHYVTDEERLVEAIDGIQTELAERLAELEGQGKLLEAQRLRMRTSYDLEMLREVGSCSGVENYSMHLDGRAAPPTAVHAARLLPRRLAVHRRRVARRDPAAARAVRGRPFAQGHARRPRLPAAVGDGQPAAAVRGVHRAGQPGRLHVGDAERVRAGDLDADRRAGRAARPG